MEPNKAKTYWKGLEELSNDTNFVKNASSEFPEYLPINKNAQNEGDTENYLTHRRDFLKMLGFGVAAVSLAACETPVKKAIPYLNKPEDIDPSIPNYYASTYTHNGEYASVLVKTKDGRPVKIEANTLASFSGGSTPRVQASVLGLYDNERLAGPTVNGKSSTWSEVDGQIINKLTELAAANSEIKIVTSTCISPSIKKSIGTFIEKYPNASVITFDADSDSGALDANLAMFGVRALPTLDFSTCKTIVSIGSDFLGTLKNHSIYSKQFVQTRKLNKDKKSMSRLYSFESNLSLTGANADVRTPIKPSDEGQLVLGLYNAVAKATGNPTLSSAGASFKNLEEAAKDLVRSRGESLVLSGSNDTNIQIIVNHINKMLDNYGKTLDITKPLYTSQGSDADFSQFVSDLASGKVQGVIFMGVNPVYNSPFSAEIQKGLGKAKLSVSLSDRIDETSALVQYVCPDNHFLESWGDAEPAAGYASLLQPVIQKIFKTRQAIESFLSWSGDNTTSYDFVRNVWRDNYYSKQSNFLTFNEFWNNVLHDGVFTYAASTAPIVESSVDLGSIASSVAASYKSSSTYEYQLYKKVAIGDGSMANNPWLQEMPDPISKACWDNYAAIAKATATELGVKDGDIVKIDTPSGSLELPVLVQPGQAKGVVSIALGYGRTAVGKCGNGIGKNAFPWARFEKSGTLAYYGTIKGISNTGAQSALAQTQTHHTIMGRAVVQESTLSDYVKDPKAGRYFPKVATYEGAKKPMEISLWSEYSRNNHSWGMAIDLNSCLGCGACTIACQAENNVPVVGKQEVINRREMHWIRIDRYYSSDADRHDFKGLEEAAENPEVVFQPMMCQHCNHAPCETVCPVLATTHSGEGLNQMTYNRCIGTRYCANNCPYKVRRFNWFKYHNNVQFADVNLAMNNDLGKMVLNPDVTVRSRGVMEKCTFCVQRIQEGKLTAKKEKRRPVDGEINTACAQACSTGAIVFGDMNDPESKIAKILQLEYYEDGTKKPTEDRAFHVLEEINVQPNIAYLTKIRNKIV